MSQITHSQFHQDFYKGNRLGSGTSGSVYEIFTRKNDAPYALKEIIVNKVDKIADIISEIQVMALLNDEAIPKIYYYFTEGLIKTHESYLGMKGSKQEFKAEIKFSIIMERCDQTLDKQISRLRKQNGHGKPIYSRSQLRNFLASIISLFAKMQEHNIIHRDIKTENILIKHDRQKGKIYKVCDFGYAIKCSKYSSASITGTKGFLSPKIQEKFEDNNKIIPGNNFKDDVYSLGLVVLHMMVPNFDGIVNQKIFQGVERLFDAYFMNFMRKMLAKNQDQRYDFTSLKRDFFKLIDKKLRPAQIIDLQIPNMIEEAEQGQMNPLAVNMNSISDKKIKEIVTNSIQIQTQEMAFEDIEGLMLNSSQKNKKLLFQKIFSQDYDETVYIDNPHPDKESESQKTEHLLKSLIFDAPGQINCMIRLKDFLILGMRGKIGVFTLNLSERCRLYILNLIFLDKLMGDSKRFNITQIQVKNNYLAIVGTAQFFLYCSVHQFLIQIGNLITQHDQLVLTKQIRKNSRQNIFISQQKRKQSKLSIFQTNTFNCFNAYYSSSTISHIDVSTEPLFDQVQVLMGHYNGSISFYGVQTSIIQDSSPITKVKLIDNTIIYATVEGRIKMVSLTGTSIHNLKTETIKSYNTRSPIVHFEIMSSANQNILKKNTLDLFPFLRIITYEGEQIILNKQMKNISTSKISSSEINTLIQSGQIWNIHKSILSDNMIVEKIKNIQQNGSNQKQRLILTCDGILMDTNLEIIHDLGIYQPSSLIMDSNYLIAASYDGKVNVFYTEEIRTKSIVVEKNEINQNSVLLNFQKQKSQIQNQSSLKNISKSYLLSSQSRRFRQLNDSERRQRLQDQMNLQKNSAMRKMLKQN